MSSLPVISSVTTGQLFQTRAADADRGAHEARTQAREASSQQQTEAAEGVGEMTQEEGSTDRDADGRRLWERPLPRRNAEETPADTEDPPPSVDPTGESGGQLDLSG